MILELLVAQKKKYGTLHQYDFKQPIVRGEIKTG